MPITFPAYPPLYNPQADAFQPRAEATISSVLQKRNSILNYQTPSHTFRNLILAIAILPMIFLLGALIFAIWNVHRRRKRLAMVRDAKWGFADVDQEEKVSLHSCNGLHDTSKGVMEITRGLSLLA